MSDSKFTLLPDFLDNALKNATDPISRNIGQTLADCWYLVFGGISFNADKKRIQHSIGLEAFKEELNSSLSAVPENIRKEPSSQIVLSALDNAKYCVEEKELRDLFVALLAASIDSTQFVHPSFSQIIKQMSPQDAQMLRFLVRQKSFPICDIVCGCKNDFRTLAQNVFLDGPAHMSHQEKSLSISFLISVGLLEIPDGLYFSDSVYEKFKKSEPYTSFLTGYTTNELSFEKRIVRLTALGKSFASCCVSNHVYG